MGKHLVRFSNQQVFCGTQSLRLDASRPTRAQIVYDSRRCRGTTVAVDFKVVGVHRRNHDRLPVGACPIGSCPNAVSYLARGKTAFCGTLKARCDDFSSLRSPQRDHCNSAFTDAGQQRAVCGRRSIASVGMQNRSLIRVNVGRPIGAAHRIAFAWIKVFG